MDLRHFNRLHSQGIVRVTKSHQPNLLPSATDPTQDCPISRLQFAANGAVLNVRDTKLPYNNLPLEKMTVIDRRHRDDFDVVGDLQREENILKNHVQLKRKENHEN